MFWVHSLVVRVVQPSDAKGAGGLAGMGVAFEELTAESQRVVQRLTHKGGAG